LAKSATPVTQASRAAAQNIRRREPVQELPDAEVVTRHLDDRHGLRALAQSIGDVEVPRRAATEDHHDEVRHETPRVVDLNGDRIPRI